MFPATRTLSPARLYCKFGIFFVLHLLPSHTQKHITQKRPSPSFGGVFPFELGSSSWPPLGADIYKTIECDDRPRNDTVIDGEVTLGCGIQMTFAVLPTAYSRPLSVFLQQQRLL